MRWNNNIPVNNYVQHNIFNESAYINLSQLKIFFNSNFLNYINKIQDRY